MHKWGENGDNLYLSLKKNTKFKHIWTKYSYGKRGLTYFVLITEKWSSNGCSADGLVHELGLTIQMDTIADRLA